MRPSAQPFLWKWVLFTWEWKIISISKAEHLTSFWYRGPGDLENGLLPSKKSVELPENLTIACVFLQPQRICLWVLFPTITSDRDSGECLCQIPSFDVHSIPFRWADVYFLHKTRNKKISPRTLAVKKCTKSGMHVQSCCFCVWNL